MSIGDNEINKALKNAWDADAYRRWRDRHPVAYLLDSIIDWSAVVTIVFLLAQCSCGGCMK